MRKSKLRVVPALHPSLGSCWALKENETVVGTFISKQHAEKKKLELDSAAFERFLISDTRNQELSIEF
jgi:hypothetical protein